MPKNHKYPSRLAVRTKREDTRPWLTASSAIASGFPVRCTVEHVYRSNARAGDRCLCGQEHKVAALLSPWVEGQWRVAACAETARGWWVSLLPLQPDGALDVERDQAFTYGIEYGTMGRRPRVKRAILCVKPLTPYDAH